MASHEVYYESPLISECADSGHFAQRRKENNKDSKWMETPRPYLIFTELHWCLKNLVSPVVSFHVEKHG